MRSSGVDADRVGPRLQRLEGVAGGRRRILIRRRVVDHLKLAKEAAFELVGICSQVPCFRPIREFEFLDPPKKSPVPSHREFSRNFFESFVFLSPVSAVARRNQEFAVFFPVSRESPSGWRAISRARRSAFRRAGLTPWTSPYAGREWRKSRGRRSRRPSSPSSRSPRSGRRRRNRRRADAPPRSDAHHPRTDIGSGRPGSSRPASRTWSW